MSQYKGLLIRDNQSDVVFSKEAVAENQWMSCYRTKNVE